MKIVIAPATATSSAVLERLLAWSATSLLEPFCWWTTSVDADPGLDVRIVRNGADDVALLADALGRTRPDEIDIVALYPAGADEAIGGAFAGAVDRCLTLASDVLAFQPGRPADAVMVVVPGEIGQLVPPELFRLGWAANVYVAPEDRAGPELANHLAGDPARLPAHAAHAVATLADLWSAVPPDSAPVLPELRRLQTSSGEDAAVQVVRCFSRGVDFGYLVDQIAARVFQPAEAWPKPDRNCERISQPGDVVPAVVERYLRKHESVLGVSPVEQLTLPPLPEYGLLEALKLLVQQIVGRLRRRPIERARGLVIGWHDALGQKIQKASEGSIKVKMWRTNPPPDTTLLELREQLERLPSNRGGPIGPAWRDLVEFSLALVDGAQMPSGLDAEALQRDTRRLVLTQPHHIAPHPADAPPSPDGTATYACDPLQRDPSLVRSRQSTDGDSDPPELAAEDIEFAERYRVTPLWLVGVALARQIDKARAESAHDAREVVAQAETPDGHQPVATEGVAAEQLAPTADTLEAGRRARRRRFRRKLLMRTFLAGLVVAAAARYLPTVALIPIIPVVLLSWLFGLATLVRGVIREEDVEQRDIAQAQVDELNRIMLRRQRTADIDRLSARYVEYLDWAEVVGWMVHEPWVGARLRALRAPTSLDAASLPAAFELGIGDVSEDRLTRLGASAGEELFRREWLSDLFGHTTRQAMRFAADAVGAAADGGAAVPYEDPFADTSGDPASPRHLLLGAIRRGDGRSLNENAMTQELLAFVDGLPLDEISSGVASVGDFVGEEFGPTVDPLPPAAAWELPPTNLGDLASHVAPSIVRIRQSGSEVDRGLGVVVDGAGVVLTAFSALPGDAQLEVVLPLAAGIVSAERAGEWPDADVAVLRLAEIPGAAELSAAAFSDAAWQAGDAVVTPTAMGVRSGLQSMNWGVVVNPRRVGRALGRAAPVLAARLDHHGSAPPAGAPVFDGEGRLKGLWCRIRLDGDGGASPGAAVPAALLRGALETQARDGQTAPTTVVLRSATGFLSELAHAQDIALLPQHWRMADGHERVERILSRAPGGDEQPRLRSLTRGSDYLQPVRLMASRVDLPQLVRKDELSSCRPKA